MLPNLKRQATARDVWTHVKPLFDLVLALMDVDRKVEAAAKFVQSYVDIGFEETQNNRQKPQATDSSIAPETPKPPPQEIKFLQALKTMSIGSLLLTSDALLRLLEKTTLVSGRGAISLIRPGETAMLPAAVSILDNALAQFSVSLNRAGQVLVVNHPANNKDGRGSARLTRVEKSTSVVKGELANARSPGRSVTFSVRHQKSITRALKQQGVELEDEATLSGFQLVFDCRASGGQLLSWLCIVHA